MGAIRAGILALALLGAGCAQTGGPFGAAPGAGAAGAGDQLALGHELMEAGEFELALRVYRRAAVERGLTADVLAALGSANLRLGRTPQAERLLRQAVEEDPDFAAAWNNLGVTLMERGAYAEARESFRRAFALVNGGSEEIRDNLRRAIAKTENPGYGDVNTDNAQLVKRGDGRYVLLPAPGQEAEQ